MKPVTKNLLQICALVALALLFSACTAGDPQFSENEPAGFWYGLWHGMISVITLIVHIFSDGVRVYEVNNSGGWYDFGFLLGVIVVWGGSSHMQCKTARQKQREKEWEAVGEKVEKKMMRKLKAWAEDDSNDAETLKEWDEIGDKVEKKVKRILREWAEKE